MASFWAPGYWVDNEYFVDNYFVDEHSIPVIFFHDQIILKSFITVNQNFDTNIVEAVTLKSSIHLAFEDKSTVSVDIKLQSVID